MASQNYFYSRKYTNWHKVQEKTRTTKENDTWKRQNEKESTDVFEKECLRTRSRQQRLKTIVFSLKTRVQELV